MRSTATIVSIASFLSLIGCASYTPRTFDGKPPGAPAGRRRRDASGISNSRLCTPSDLPARGAAAEQGGHDAHHGSDATAEKTAVGEGKVIAVVPSSSQLVIEHGPIKDFMDAMTMGYPTEPASLLEGLKPGDKVRFAIDPKRKVIVKVEKIN